jgi:hypothetical protein
VDGGPPRDTRAVEFAIYLGFGVLVGLWGLQALVSDLLNVYDASQSGGGYPATFWTDTGVELLVAIIILAAGAFLLMAARRRRGPPAYAVPKGF